MPGVHKDIQADALRARPMPAVGSPHGVVLPSFEACR